MALEALDGGDKKYNIFDNVSIEKEDTLTLLDLSANGQFQTSMAADRLVERLIHMGFSDKIKEIQLIISDVSSKKSTEVYAAELVESFLSKGFEVSIKTPRVMGEYSLISPPCESGGGWAIYAMPEREFKCIEIEVPISELEASLKSYSYYKEHFKKKIFEGALETYFKEHDCTISKESLSGHRL